MFSPNVYAGLRNVPNVFPQISRNSVCRSYVEPSHTVANQGEVARQMSVFVRHRLFVEGVRSVMSLSAALILDELVDVFFTKLPQTLSLCGPKFYRQGPRLPAS